MKNFTRRNALTLGAILLCISFISPWITILGLISAGPSNFTEVAIVFIGAMAVVVLSVATRRFMRPVSIVVGALVFLEAGYVWFALSEQDTNELVTPGWGLWFTIATGAYLIVSTFVVSRPPMEKYRINSVVVTPTLEDKPFSQGPPTAR